MPESVLRDVAGRGILPSGSAAKLRECARLALEQPGVGRRVLARLPAAEAKRILRRFPSIGEPGAEKILLFAGIHPFLALDSNALRVLVRLGYGKEEKSYPATYRAVQAAATRELPESLAARRDAVALLRRHGQELCRRTAPRCEVCPLRTNCRHAAAAGRA